MVKKLKLEKSEFYNKTLVRFVLILLFVSVYTYFLLNCQDNDMYFLISTGRNILKNGILYTNPNSVLDIDIINQQWLYCIIIALFDKLGLIGHLLFVFIQNILLVTVSSVFLYKKTKNIDYSIFSSLFILCINCNYMINIRPQIITMILLISHILILEKYNETNNKNWLILLILIGILEANLHGSVFIYHLFISLPYIFEKKLKIDLNILIFTILMIPTILINPYGIHMLEYTFKSIFANTFKYVSIIELQPTIITSIKGLPIVVIIFLYIFLISKKNINKQIVIYTTIIVLASLLIYRNITLLFLPYMFVFEKLYDYKQVIKKIFNRIFLIYLSLITVALILTIILNFNTFNKLSNNHKDNYLPLLENITNKNSTIYTDFNTGGLVHYYGFNNVFIDARPEIYLKALNNKKDILIDYSISYYGKNLYTNEYYSITEIHNLLKQYDFEYILCYQHSIMNRVCESLDDYSYIETKNGVTLWKVKQ